MPFLHDSSFHFPRLKQVSLPTGRVYQVESGEYVGEVYPSITRVLGSKKKPELEQWKRRVGAAEAARVSARATAQGSSLHKLNECYLGNVELPKHMPHVSELWAILRPWLDTNVTTVFAQEADVFSAKLGVAGRMDLLILYRDMLAIADLKSAARLKKEEWIRDYYLQGTFYAYAVYERTGRAPRRIVIPVVSPDGLQVFECSPREHFDELVERVTTFYSEYVTETIPLDMPVSPTV
jgi:hypothetical protein